METIMTGTILPLGICLALPVLVVWLVMRARINRDNRRTEILIEAIRHNQEIDVNKMTELFAKKPRTDFQLMLNRLIWGLSLTFSGLACLIYWIVCICQGENSDDELFIGLVALGVGIAFLIVAYIYKKQLSKEQKTVSH